MDNRNWLLDMSPEEYEAQYGEPMPTYVGPDYSISPNSEQIMRDTAAVNMVAPAPSPGAVDLAALFTPPPELPSGPAFLVSDMPAQQTYQEPVASSVENPAPNYALDMSPEEITDAGLPEYTGPDYWTAPNIPQILKDTLAVNTVIPATPPPDAPPPAVPTFMLTDDAFKKVATGERTSVIAPSVPNPDGRNWGLDMTPEEYERQYGLPMPAYTGPDYWTSPNSAQIIKDTAAVNTVVPAEENGSGLLAAAIAIGIALLFL